MGFRRAKFTQRNTNLQKNIFVDDRLRGHHPRALSMMCQQNEFLEPPVAPQALICRISLDDMSGGRDNFGMRLLHPFIVETDNPEHKARVSKNALPKNV